MTPAQASQRCEDICRTAPVIPVLVIDDPRQAGPLAQALIAGGLPVLEVTLRTPNALECIREMAHIPGGIVGAGTVLTPQDVTAAQAAGAGFAVSPGATDRLLDASEKAGLPLLPGAATATEAMRLLDRGYTMQKFFPAKAAGGPAALKAISGPLPQIRFCPTGGITADSMSSYLALPNVLCVGGSWVAPSELIASGDWAGIEALARSAARSGAM